MIVQNIPKRGAVLGLSLLVLSGLTLTLTQMGSLPTLKSINLFHLVGNLNQTTGKLLANTQALHHEVGTVNQQLSQLETQQTLLSQQLQTGKQLQQALTTQIIRTGTDVSLMREILVTENVTAHKTALIARASGQLTTQVNKNNAELSHLQSALNLSAAESQTMNGQLTTLLQQLAASEQEFKAFGQVDSLLSGLSGNSANSTQKLLGKATQLGNAAQLGNTTNQTGSLLNSTTNTVNQLLP